MRRIFFLSLSGMAFCLLLSTAALAGGYKTADYPLRVHIYSFNSHSHYYERQVSYVDGEGRANLFENGEPRAFEFGYRCGDRLRKSDGFETYMARWKKPGKTLEILLPVLGKPGADESCELKVEMKDGVVYRWRNGSLVEQPAAQFKEWMIKHQYDPEHGNNVPVMAAAKPSGGADDQ
jgi:hypothetical protein